VDPLSLIGLGLVFLAIIGSTIMDGNSFGPLIGPSSLVLVLLGTIGTVLAGYRMEDAKRLPKAFVVAFTGSPPEPNALVTQMMEFAESARREGILALESKMEELEDPFLKAGLTMVVDGVEGDEVREVLETEVNAMEDRHLQLVVMIKKMVEYAPTLGMIGTVIGLVNVLGNLANPEALGTGMALALLTTLYGVFFANIFFAPVATKLEKLNSVEVAAREMTLEGVLAIREGASPRDLVERLEARLEPELRIGFKARSEGNEAA
jgi:chemotaxis protein MotA